MQRAVDYVKSIKLKEGFWFQSGAFNQSNGIQYAFCIYIICYVAVAGQ